MRIKNSILIPGLIYITIIVVLLILILFLNEADKTLIIILASATLLTVIGGIGYFIIGIYYPLIRLKHKISALAEAEVISSEKGSSYHEFKEVDDALDLFIERLNEIVQIANNLSEGLIDDEFEVKGNYDELGHALLKVKQSIIKSNEETLRRRKMDEQQYWQSRGLTKFGELLRDFESNVRENSGRFIRELTSYMEMEVGGLFLTVSQDEELVLELFGVYAFDRNKDLQKVFRFGEGLVGRCAIEKDNIVITDAPDDYIQIQSGIGAAKPSTIILTPIIFDEQVLGVVELASFSEVEKYKIDFLTSLGLSIASLISKAGITAQS